MNAVGAYRPMQFRYSTGYINDGFWGCSYINESTHEIVVCFKGTGSAKLTEEQLDQVGSTRPNDTIVGDITADIKLFIGVIPNQASTADEFFGSAHRPRGSSSTRSARMFRWISDVPANSVAAR